MTLSLGTRRKAAPVTMQDLVRVAPLTDTKAIPVLVTPTVAGVDLVAWAGTQRAYIEQLLLQHKALLFRGFYQQHSNQFAAFVHHTADEALEYRDRTTPRTQVGDRLYTSTIYPADRHINLHNEGTYWRRWPLKLYFACVTAASVGGETPIANVTNVLHRLPPALRERFTEAGFMLVRNYNRGFGLPWQEVFQTSCRAEVERFCLQHDIEFEWLDAEHLRTRQVRPAIRQHPHTGEQTWFNHAAFFHLSAYPSDIRAAMLADVGEDGLPYQTFYGDGTAIDADVITEIQRAYDAEKMIFPWENGDILMLDNMTVAHGREPYAGERQVLVSMNEAYGDSGL